MNDSDALLRLHAILMKQLVAQGDTIEKLEARLKALNTEIVELKKSMSPVVE